MPDLSYVANSTLPQGMDYGRDGLSRLGFDGEPPAEDAVRVVLCLDFGETIIVSAENVPHTLVSAVVVRVLFMIHRT